VLKIDKDKPTPTLSLQHYVYNKVRATFTVYSASQGQDARHAKAKGNSNRVTVTGNKSDK
jgi:hypothetical protein